MNIKDIPRASYLDILFDGRNKTYGAYELRKHYAQRTRNAVIGVAVFTSLLLAYPLLASKEGTHALPRFDRPVVLGPAPDLPKEKKQPELPKPRVADPAPPTATITNPPPKVVPNDEAIHPPKTNEELAGKTISNTEHDGAIGGPPSTITAPGSTGTGLVEQPKASSEPMKWVTQPPAFNGDLQAWLAAHVHYPEAEQAEGKEGKAYVQFVVSEDGSISDVSILRSSDRPGLDAEAIRLVKAMPRWTGGKNNGVPVKVFFQIPIVFVLND